MATPVTWFEILSRNSVGLGEFYAKLFGWKLEPFPGDTPYALVTYAHFADPEGNVMGLVKAGAP